MRRLGLGLVLALAAAPSAAWPHSGLGKPEGFASGFSHPFGGADHLLAMVAVGVWGAFLGRPLVAALPVVFPAFMAAGAMAGMAGAPLPHIEVGIAASLTGLGLAVAFAIRTPVWVACAIVGLFGLCHGYAHGRELPLSADPGAYCAGFVLATGLLHVAGIALGEARRSAWGERMLRAAGVGMVGAGLFFLRAAAGA